MIFDSNGKTRIDDDRLLKLLLRTILSDFTAKFPEAFLIVRGWHKAPVRFLQQSSSRKSSVAGRFTSKHQVCNRCFFSASRLPTGEATIECRRVPVKRIEKESMNRYRLWEVLEGGARSVSVPWPTAQKFCSSAVPLRMKASKIIDNLFIYIYSIYN